MPSALWRMPLRQRSVVMGDPLAMRHVLVSFLSSQLEGFLQSEHTGHRGRSLEILVGLAPDDYQG